LNEEESTEIRRRANGDDHLLYLQLTLCNIVTECTITTHGSHAVSSSVAQTVLKCYTSLRSRII